MAYWNQKDQTEWNADDEALKIIFALKAEYIDLAKNVTDEESIEALYSLLRVFYGEAKAAFNPEERKFYDKRINNLERIRAGYLSDGYWDDEEIAKFNHELRDFYEEVCIALTEHGAYLRKRADPSKAALQK